MKRKTLIQKLSKHKNRVRPKISKEIFNKPWVPPPTNFYDHEENQKHYEYKIYLGETIRDRFLDLSIIAYDYNNLPLLYNQRYAKNIKYLPDIFMMEVDITNSKIFLADIEINGLIHYKNKTQLIKTKDKKDLVLKYLQHYKSDNFPNYKPVASYVVFDVDDFEYFHIDKLIYDLKIIFYKGDVYPSNFDTMMNQLIKTAF